MKALHRVVLLRLALAWLIVSLLAAGVIYLAEIRKFNDAIVALVAQQAGGLAPEGLGNERHANAALNVLMEDTRAFMRRNFVSIHIYDRQDRMVSNLANPKYRLLEESLHRNATGLPRDGGTHARKRTLDGVEVLQIVVPLSSPSGELTGHFAGSFVIDAADRARFHEQLRRPLAGILLAIFATVLVLYPVVISLNRSLVRASEDILRANLEITSVLGTAIAKRDSETGEHNHRVALYAIRLGERIGIEAHGMRDLILGAYLHDVGKIGIPDNILLKPGRLTEAEFVIMRTHVALGVEIIAKSNWLQAAREIVECHHEKYDGRGYLQGLKGKAIPLNARIFAIVDVFDALTSRRPYKEPMTVPEALAIIERDAGSHFDPDLVVEFREIAGALHSQFSTMPPAALHDALSQRTSQYFLGGQFALGRS
jgi:putative nucleotidyltransferase with HDIG domain